MKKILSVVVSLLLVLSHSSVFVFANESKPVLQLDSQSACLMEASTGKILYEQNADEKLEPASVTKIMSLILIMEALDDGSITLETMVSGSEHSSSMGGSQIWLEAGEQLSVNDMLKAIVVASANDCTVAMAEHIAGSEETFVEKMNEKAKMLGMENTNFVNATGLPVENHYTTARDIAIMTRELLKHEQVLNYTNIWMDTLRNGEFGISNTNKLIRFYNGANGMKTGFTSSALYCLSATAKRSDMQLIAATMKGSTSDKRFQDAKKLLDFGFANYSVYKADLKELPDIKVKGGKKETLKLKCETSNILLPKGVQKLVEQSIEIDESIKAPVKKGTVVGKVVFSANGETVCEVPVYTCEGTEKLEFSDLFYRLIAGCISIR